MQGVEKKAAGESDPRKYRTWIRKCEAEMEADEGDLQAAAVAAAALADDSADFSAGSTAAATVTTTETPPPPLATVTRAPVSSAPAHLRIKFQYYQSHEKVTVAVLEKGLTETTVDVEIGAKRLTGRRKPDGSLLFDKVLYEEVLPDKLKTRFMASKVGDRKGRK